VTALQEIRVDNVGGTVSVGGGFLVADGPLVGSYLEAGWGLSELLEPSDNLVMNRLKVDAFISFQPFRPIFSRWRFWDRLPRMFFQIYSDTNPTNNASNEILTFVGFDLDVAKAFAGL